jgi:hypothetical protein
MYFLLPSLSVSVEYKNECNENITTGPTECGYTEFETFKEVDVTTFLKRTSLAYTVSEFNIV